MTDRNSYHEELAARLANVANPLPHPGALADAAAWSCAAGLAAKSAPLKDAMDESIAAHEQRQRDLGLLASLGDESDEIPAYNVRGLLIGAASLIVLGLMLAAWRFA